MFQHGKQEVSMLGGNPLCTFQQEDELGNQFLFGDDASTHRNDK
jgi:hypothetical protein